MLVKYMRKILVWVLMIFTFMVFMPIIWLMQAAITPIELIYNTIMLKRIVEPEEYWVAFMTNVSNAFALLRDAVESD